MKKHVPLIAFVAGMLIGVLIGVFATAKFMTRRLSAQEEKMEMVRALKMIDTEQMIIWRQYDLHRQNGEWPSHDLIATYQTSFDRTFTDRMGNRADLYKIRPTIGHSNKYVVVGLFPNGVTKYIETRDELPPSTRTQ